MARAGNLFIDLAANVAQLQTDFRQAKGVLDGFARDAERVGAGLQRAFRFASVVAGSLALGAAFRKSVQEAEAAERASAQLNAVLRSTAGTAGLSREALDKQAEALGKMAALDDDAVRGAQALLLTFKNIKGDAFEEATRATLDLSTAMGTDLKSAAVLVGKALNDPKTGLTQLTRYGIQFSEAQKATIKSLVDTGQAAKAQTLILRELGSEFGGSAKANAETLEGRLRDLGNASDNLAEQFGLGLSPAIKLVAEDLAKASEGGFSWARAMGNIASKGASNFLIGTLAIRRSWNELEAWVQEKSASVLDAWASHQEKLLGPARFIPGADTDAMREDIFQRRAAASLLRDAASKNRAEARIAVEDAADLARRYDEIAKKTQASAGGAALLRAETEGVSEAAGKAAKKWADLLGGMRDQTTVLQLQAAGAESVAEFVEKRLAAERSLGPLSEAQLATLAEQVDLMQQAKAAAEGRRKEAAALADVYEDQRKFQEDLAEQVAKDAEAAEKARVDAAAKAAAEMQKPFERAAENIQRGLGDAFTEIFETGKLNAKSLADFVKSTFARLAGELVAQNLGQAVLGPLVGSLGFGGVAAKLTGTAVGAGASAAGAGGGTLALLGGGGLSLAGVLSGLAPLATAGLTLAAIPGILKAIQGDFGKITRLEGASSGALAGTLYGIIPGIGTAIGATIGALFPDIFGGKFKPSVGIATRATDEGFLGSASSPFGVVGVTQKRKLDVNALAPFLEGLADLDRSLAKFLSGGEIGRVSSALQDAGVRNLRFGGSFPAFQIINERVDAALRAVSEDFDGFVARTVASGEDLAQAATRALDFRRGLREFLDEVETGRKMTEAAKAVQTLNDKLADLEAEARKIGLTSELDRIAGARDLGVTRLREDFDRDIRLALLQLTDPISAALEEQARSAAERLRNAQDLGADLVEVERLAAEERRRILEQSFAGLTSLKNDLLFGPASNLAPEVRLGNAREAYEALARQVEGGALGRLGDLEAAARAYIDAQRGFSASGEDTAATIREVLALIERLSARMDAQTSGASGPAAQTAFAATETAAEVRGLRADVKALVSRLDAYAPAMARAKASGALGAG